MVLRALQTAEGRAEAAALFAPKPKETTPCPYPVEEKLPANQRPRVKRAAPPPSAASASGPVRRSSRRFRPTVKREEAGEDGGESSAAPPAPPPAAPFAAVAQQRHARLVAKRKEWEGAVSPLELPPLPPLPFVEFVSAAQPAAASPGNGQPAPRGGATGSGSIAQGGLRVDVPPGSAYGRMSPVEASQLWALQSPGACLQSPPILTDEVLALFDLEEEEGGAEGGGGGEHTVGV